MLVTAEMLLENSKRINNEERKKVKIHIKELNGEIECELLNKEDYLDLILSKEKDKDLEIIYNSCPIFRDDKLIDSLNCRSKPTQVVAKVLKDPTVYKLADFILTASGYGEVDLVSLAEETKN
ncbi:regulator [Fusobacterium animalis]|uniref:Regulator n=1 Tax=Fusobacterium animalis TaxID=76859 RepID=A0A2B7YQY9_9FUSO|nr:regulator [Fusobacterium animalis]PGH24076.1 regulator [Fusobacterium animalis]